MWVWALFLLVMLESLATADTPCELYDVTTLRENALSGYKYEVHSRTNAVGRKTNYERITGLTDPFEKISCHFGAIGSQACSRWIDEPTGFQPYSFVNDPTTGWKATETEAAYDTRERCCYNPARNVLVYRVPQGYALRFDIEVNQHGVLYIGTSSKVPMDGLQFTKDTHYQSKLEYQEGHFSADCRYQYDVGSSQTCEPFDVSLSSLHGSIDSPAGADFVSLFVRNENGIVCISAGNSDCLFTRPSDEDLISVITDAGKPALTALPVYAYLSDSIVSALRLSGTIGSATIHSFTTDQSRKLCISVRYFLGKDQTVNVKFFVGSALKELIHSANLKGQGDFASEQFSMIIPKSQDQETLEVAFEAQSDTSLFILRSARMCSAKDRDVIIMKAESLCSSEYCKISHNSTGAFTELGFGAECSDLKLPTPGLNKTCLNGGIDQYGWCQCLPGFTGVSCEKACPPGKFGADCGGTCVDSPDCKGVSLAAAFQPFECARGFTGPECNEACENGFYGPNCRLECGECLHGTCNRFSGLCNGPCKRGRIGKTCQDHLATVDSVKILSTTLDSAEGLVTVTTLSEDDLQSYPYVKLLYTKMPVPEQLVFENVTPPQWSSKVMLLNSTTLQFKLDNLDYDEKYYVQALLIHKSGDFYSSPSWEVNPHSVFSTHCFVSTFDRVDVLSTEERLSVTWKVSDSDMYACQKRGFQLEIYLPEIDSPMKKYLGPHETNTTIDAVFPRNGALRLGVVFETKDTVWTYHEFSYQANTEVTRSLDIVDKSTRSIDFAWVSSDDVSEDILSCEPEQILCFDRKLEIKTQRVRKGQFTIKGLSPFTTYVCTLSHSGIQAMAMTQPDQPAGSPKPHDHPVQVTNTTAFIQWKGADCLDINGIPQEFRIELWRGNTIEATTTVSETTFKTSFDSLHPETLYEAKIYVVNQLGWNAAYFLSIPFKTKSTTPNAVTDLLVYKRTRNDLWLRWSPPDNESNVTVVVGYKVTASAPGVETQVSEIAPAKCPTWPDYFCHRLRSLIPDIEYNIQVQARNNKVDLFGPPTITKAMTKEGVPDAPVDVRVYNRTADSVVLTWEVPVLLHSNPKFFVVTLEQTDENNSQENPTDPVDIKVSIIEGQRIYEAKFDQLNPATTYVATIGAGLRGQRSMLTVNTPPKDPPSPPAPTIDETSGNKRIVFHGIRSKPEFMKLLSGYLLLVASDNTVGLNHGITDPEVFASIQSQLADSNFFVAHEFAPSLTDEVFNFEAEFAVPGNFSLIQNTRLEPGREYRFALAAISTYCGANAVAVSPVLAFNN